MSGVGGREKRARGEKAKEKESAGSVNAPSSEAHASGSVPVLPTPAAGTVGSVDPPRSPKRERTRRGGGGHAGGGGGAAGGAPPIKISSILQRNDTGNDGGPLVAIEKGVSEGSIDVHPAGVGGGNRGGRRGRGGHMKEKGPVPSTVKHGG